MMVEVGKFYNTEVKDLRAASLKVHDNGTSILMAGRSYWDASVITLRCEYIDENCVIFREFNTSKIVYGVDDLSKTFTPFEAIDIDNYENFKKNLLKEESLWVSKDSIHEITKNNIIQT